MVSLKFNYVFYSYIYTSGVVIEVRDRLTDFYDATSIGNSRSGVDLLTVLFESSMSSDRYDTMPH